MNLKVMGRLVAVTVVVAAFCAAGTRSADAQNVRERDVFVWIAGFDLEPSQQIARMFHEDSPTHLASLGQVSGQTSLFSIRQLLLDDEEIGDYVWFRGVKDVRLMFGPHPEYETVPTSDYSSDDQHRRLVDRCVLKMSGRTA